MSEIITAEQAFNNQYFATNKKVDLESLFSYAIRQNQLSLEQVDMITSVYKDQIIEYVSSTIEYDDEDDINITIKDATKEISNALDDYLSTLNNPFEALKYILNEHPMNVITYTLQIYKQKQESLKKRAFKLSSESKLLQSNNREYASFINYLKKRIDNPSEPYSLYQLMNSSDIISISNLDELDTLIDWAFIELSIVSKFDKNELKKFLLSFKLEDLCKNISTTALYNYMFNSFYKDTPSLLITPEMEKIIIDGIKSKFFDESDVTDIIENGKIDFNQEEKKYIYNNFAPSFKTDIIDNKYVERIVKTK